MPPAFKKPNRVKIKGRSSSITNAFINGIVPYVKPTEEEIDDVLNTFGMTRESVVCAYCGGAYSEWDHFQSLIEKDGNPSGYITEIHNLVPACGKCNQSKGSSYWYDWMISDAPLSPKSKGIPDLNERIERLKKFEEKYTRIKCDFQEIVGKDLWEKHINNRKQLLDLMESCQETSDKIQKIIDEAFKHKK